MCHVSLKFTTLPRNILSQGCPNFVWQNTTAVFVGLFVGRTCKTEIIGIQSLIVYVGKGKVYSRTGYESPEGSRSIALVFL
jgi:hypothetical protein